jgi:hypothetical protein
MPSTFKIKLISANNGSLQKTGSATDAVRKGEMGYFKASKFQGAAQSTLNRAVKKQSPRSGCAQSIEQWT